MKLLCTVDAKVASELSNVSATHRYQNEILFIIYRDGCPPPEGVRFSMITKALAIAHVAVHEAFILSSL